MHYNLLEFDSTDTDTDIDHSDMRLYDIALVLGLVLGSGTFSHRSFHGELSRHL
jgi:hypothetical protein